MDEFTSQLPQDLEPQVIQQKKNPLMAILISLLILLLLLFAFLFKDTILNALFPQKPGIDLQNVPAVSDEIIVKFKKEVSQKDKQAILKKYNLVFVETIEQLGIERFKVDPKDRDRAIQQLNSNPKVEYAELNVIGQPLVVPNDPKYIDGSQWDLPLIQAPAAWDITQGSPSVIVADMDTGVNSIHEDLAGKIVPGYNFWDNNTDTTDPHGHGTFVAGRIAAATGNSKGIASLGWNTSIMPVRVTSTTSIWLASVLTQGITWVADQPGVKVINLSLGSSTFSQSVKDAIDYALGKGIVVVAGAGNKDVNCPAICYPAKYDPVIAVGSLTSAGVKASASSTGPELDVMAGGAGVWSTILNGGYGTKNGTSFSTPQVTALAALIFSVNPGLTPQQVTDIIIQTADDLGTAGFDTSYGWGKINAQNALLQAQAGLLSPSPSLSPSLSPTPTSTPAGLPSPSPSLSPSLSPTPTSTPTPESSPPPSPTPDCVL